MPRRGRRRPLPRLNNYGIIQRYLNAGAFSLRDTCVLTRLDQVRALADPLRLRLVEALIGPDKSVAELAKAAKVPMTRLYHHIDLLLEAGLIEVTHRIRRRGAEERRFQAVARRYTLDGSLLDVAPGPDSAVQNLIAMSRGILGGALDAVVEGLEQTHIEPGKSGRGLILQDRTLRLSPAGFEALAAEFPAFLDEFAIRHRPRQGGDYRFVVAAFPSTRTQAPARPQPKKR
ncbi:MAG: helix-turn-helix domain-containing protein [Gemmatimonadales bacterium]